MIVRRLAGRLAGLALTIAAVLGCCCIVLTVAGLLFDVHPLIFRSGSMSPTIPAGSLALSREVPATSLRVGDIVSVPVGDTRVAHRIVAMSPVGQGATLQLRGDANGAPDARRYHVTAADRVWFAVPLLGRVVAWLSHPPGVFALAGYAAVMLTVLLRRAPCRHDPPGNDGAGPAASERGTRAIASPFGEEASRGRGGARTGRAVRYRRRLGALLLTGMSLVVAAPWVTPSWALFTDRVGVSGRLGTATVPAPTLRCGAIGVLSVRLTWSSVPNATGYVLHYGSHGAKTVRSTQTSHTLVSAITGGTAWVTAERDFGQVIWTSPASNKRTYTVAVVSLCS